MAKVRQQKVGEMFSLHPSWDWGEDICPACGDDFTESKWSITFRYDTMALVDWKVSDGEIAEYPICDNCEDRFDPNVLLEH
jgi:hypothetical protein